MPRDQPSSTLHVPARDIPIPSSVSPAAQAMLAMRMSAPAAPAFDAPAATWRAYLAAMDATVLSMVQARTASAPVDVEEIDVDGVRIFAVTPHERDADDGAIYLDIHGGGLVQGGGELCRVFAIGSALRVRARIWSVDYRMPPDHPYPAPLDDCLTAYRALLRKHRPQDIVIGGGSAGGNLAAASVLRARDEGLPLPAAVVLGTPELDLTESGDSFQTNLGVDTVLTGSLMSSNLLYAAGHDLAHPYLSPLFGDFTKGFPPTFLSTGTRDLFLSNTVRMHRALRAAGVPAELHVVEAGPHGGFSGAPEGDELDRELRTFLRRIWAQRA